MTVEELRNKLNDLLDKDPELKDKEVLLEYWGCEDGESVLNFDSITDATYDNPYYDALILKAEV